MIDPRPDVGCRLASPRAMRSAQVPATKSCDLHVDRLYSKPSSMSREKCAIVLESITRYVDMEGSAHVGDPVVVGSPGVYGTASSVAAIPIGRGSVRFLSLRR
jgi:hypothetical protein